MSGILAVEASMLIAAQEPMTPWTNTASSSAVSCALLSTTDFVRDKHELEHPGPQAQPRALAQQHPVQYPPTKLWIRQTKFHGAVRDEGLVLIL